jgi:hypothetical protein
MVSLSRLVRAGPPPATTPARVSGISPTVLAVYERGARPALEALPGNGAGEAASRPAVGATAGAGE